MYWYVHDYDLRKQDFVVHIAMKPCFSNLPCRTMGRMRMRITIPVLRMKIVLEEGQTQRKRKKQSVSFWMALRNMKAEALTSCKGFLGTCQCLCRKKTAACHTKLLWREALYLKWRWKS